MFPDRWNGPTIRHCLNTLEMGKVTLYYCSTGISVARRYGKRKSTTSNRILMLSPPTWPGLVAARPTGCAIESIQQLARDEATDYSDQN